MCVLHISYTCNCYMYIGFGADAVSTLSEIVSQRNLRERFNTDEETWPPDQPKHFTPLVLIHHQGKHSTKQPTVVAQVI